MTVSVGPNKLLGRHPRNAKSLGNVVVAREKDSELGAKMTEEAEPLHPGH